jgi:hypothetical protein
MHFRPVEGRASEEVSMAAEEVTGEHEASATGKATEGEGHDASDEE